MGTIKEIKILKNETTGLWFIAVDGIVEYECLSDFELIEVVRELTSN